MAIPPRFRLPGFWIPPGLGCQVFHFVKELLEEGRKTREIRVFDPNKPKLTFGELKSREIRIWDPQILENDRGSKKGSPKITFYHKISLFYPIVGGSPGWT